MRASFIQYRTYHPGLAAASWLVFQPGMVTTLPSAMELVDELAARVQRGTLVLVLDFDGTLSNIVPVPDDAQLDDAMRRALEAVHARMPVAILSGRGLDDVAARVAIDGVYYAGSHGFEILCPDGSSFIHPKGPELAPRLASTAERLRSELSSLQGAIVEEKRFALAVHYRLVDEHRVPQLLTTVRAAVDGQTELKLRQGKKIVEVIPAIEWHKGTALAWLVDKMGMPIESAVYLGDDKTDEDAFVALKDAGLGVLVASEPRASAARAWLHDPAEVCRFLEALVRSPS